jgi:hypothetical protein
MGWKMLKSSASFGTMAGERNHFPDGKIEEKIHPSGPSELVVASILQWG